MVGPEHLEPASSTIESDQVHGECRWIAGGRIARVQESPGLTGAHDPRTALGTEFLADPLPEHPLQPEPESDAVDPLPDSMVGRTTCFTLGTARGRESFHRAACNRYPEASPATTANAGLASNPPDVSCTERNRWTLGRRGHRCAHSRVDGNPRQQPSTTGINRSSADPSGDPAVAKSREVSPRPFSCLELTLSILAL